LRAGEPTLRVSSPPSNTYRLKDMLIPTRSRRVYLCDRDQTLEWLEQAYRAHSTAMVWLKADPFWQKVRTDPRYHDLPRRVGLL